MQVKRPVFYSGCLGGYLVRKWSYCLSYGLLCLHSKPLSYGVPMFAYQGEIPYDRLSMLYRFGIYGKGLNERGVITL